MAAWAGLVVWPLVRWIWKVHRKGMLRAIVEDEPGLIGRAERDMKRRGGRRPGRDHPH